MTRIKIKQLLWDEFNVSHIRKHNVTKTEIEEALLKIKTHKIVKNGRMLLIGRTETRILSIIVAQEKEKKYYVVTARDAAKKEREQFYASEKE